MAVEAVLEKEKMDQMVDLVLGDMPDVPRKPDPTSYLQSVVPKFATPLSPLDPKDVMVVGDTAADIQFAKNIGAISCWAKYGHGDAERCQTLAPDVVVDGLQELEQLFSALIHGGDVGEE
ncbi:HAD-like domain-containing protein [Lasiosphaeris hirsuta]|uniref:HAD-like domain-containing protein n=1 Tax=Lasiosphaeris hirsuta TaxID=260670 RepID=A0AA40AP35_9PEZI|nr:HAD-like domain-containing protein [Lasiosphaeris hirsuta]